MRNKIFIGLLFCISFSCSRNNEDLVSTQVEDELLELKNEYNIKYQKADTTIDAKHVISITDLKRFFASLKSQSSIHKFAARGYDSPFFSEIVNANSIHIDASAEAEFERIHGILELMSVKIAGQFVIDILSVQVKCEIVTMEDRWPGMVSCSMTTSGEGDETGDGGECARDYDANLILFEFSAFKTFSVYDELHKAWWIVLWEPHFVGEWTISNGYADLYLTTRRYEEVPPEDMGD